ncbi:MAG: ankyrin repeat domain-containing protein [Cytophagaceae bacterium]|nr:MAG: ankyrin repeat domain-containing protein [Cytophagaceae bacterium]
MFVVIAFVAVALGVFYWLLQSFLNCPVRFRWHFIAALTWTVITAVQTTLLVCDPPDKGVLSYLTVLVAGSTFIPAWMQLVERNRNEFVPQKYWLLPARLFVRTIWGPLALWIAVVIIGYYGQQRFQQALSERDLPTAFLLRDCGLGDTGTAWNGGYVRRTIMHRAVENSDRETVAVYLAIGNLEQYDLDSILSVAVQQEDAMITELVLHYGASPNGISNGTEPPLYRAAKVGQTNQVRTLLYHGAKRKVYGYDGKTPFQIAKQRGYKKIVELLVSANAEQPKSSR